MRPTRRRRVFLFGNGLSVAFNADHYGLPALTAAVRDRLAGLTVPEGSSLLDRVDGIVAAIASDEQRAAGPETFEGLAGPVDRLATMFTDLVGITDLLSGNEQQAALRDLGMTLRTTHRRVVGAVLESVMAHPTSDAGWEPVNKMAEYIISVARQQGSLDVFILNYDAILDSALLIANAEGVAIADEFQGYGGRNVSVPTPDGAYALIPVFPWRAGVYYPGATLIRRHHLHGAGNWLRFRGNVYKARDLEQMRSSGVYGGWAAGVEPGNPDEIVEPVVLLCDQKENWAARWPFSEAYALLTAAVARADEVILAGYSFQDIPVNRVIAAALGPDALVTVINPNPDAERLAHRAMGPGVPVRVIGEPLPDGLLRIDRR